jgi:GNAT superfamily N-acetyltransferase
MVVTKLKSPKRGKTPLRIESVDNWHDAWKAVCAHVAKFGDAKKLRIDADGWLSARQVLLVAFVGRQIAAHVCFSVSPGKTCLEAKLDSHGTVPKFRGRGIAEQLGREAVERAESLGCKKLRGFKSL